MNRIVLLALCLIALLPAPAASQGFGQNKVQWKDLEWVTITTEHFEVYYYKGTDEAALDAARMAERAYARLSTILNHQVSRKIPLILYASHSDFQTTNVIPNLISEGTGGFTEHAKRRVVIPFTGGYGDLDHLLTHELVHAFQVDIIYGRGGGVSSPLGGGYSPPLWFMEGMAEYLSVTEVDNLTDMWLRDASLQGYLTPLHILDHVGDIRVYRFGQSILAYIGRTFGDDRIGELMKRAARTRSLDRAFQDVLGMTAEKLSRDWTEDVRRTYLPAIRDHQKAEDVARRLTDSDDGDLSRFHLAPALSPDGGKMAFIADRSLYNDLYLASALDGRVECRLVKGDRTEEFETLRFLNASFDFDPTGELLVFAARAGKEDALYIQRLKDRKILRRIAVPIDGIANPSFSPDGEWIVFVGQSGGRSDLWRVRAGGTDLERMTDDRYLALSPRYSPDGRRIAFVTDEAEETDFENLDFAEPKIAILDLETGTRTVLPDMQGTNTAPHFFPDGRHLLFVSDRTGIANLYIRDLETGRDARITDLLTGVTGVIPLAPAASLSRDGRRVVFSSFRAGSWDLFAIKDPLALANWEAPDSLAATAPQLPEAVPEGVREEGPTELEAAELERPASSAPPVPFAPLDSLLAADDSIFTHYDAPLPRPMAREIRGAATPGEEEETLALKEVFRAHALLPDTAGFRFERYRVRLSADYATANGFFASNVGAAAQTVVLFSDVLGNHNLLVGASIYGSISDSDLLFQYTNQASRINYGIALYQYRDDFFLSTARDDEEYVSQIYRGGQLSLYLPLSRFRRIELSLEGLGVDEEVYRQAFSGIGYYDYERTDRNQLYFLRPGIAIVRDNTLWGMTGPISGGRSRAYVDLSLGDIQSSRWILDRRSYWNIRQRYALALRTVGASSHGRDPQVFRIGGPYTVRGFEYGALEGTNAAFANLEFRFPLIETLELGWPLPLGFQGVRGAIFADAGTAWSENDRFRAFSRRGGWHLDDLRAAYGFAASLNIGFAALRWDLARRTDLRRNLGEWQGSISFGGDF